MSGLPGTQQRLGTSTGMRQIKDARYWQSQLQIKMDEIRRETERLLREKNNLDREKSAKKTFDRRAKETTKELTGINEIKNKKPNQTQMNVCKSSNLNSLQHYKQNSPI